MKELTTHPLRTVVTKWESKLMGIQEIVAASELQNVVLFHLIHTVQDSDPLILEGTASAMPSSKLYILKTKIKIEITDKWYLYTLIGLHFHLNWLVVLKCLVSFDVFLVFSVQVTS